MIPRLNADFIGDEALCSRVEDAGLNATAPPQQRWLDGWLVRYSPGQAKRARCVNAVALGRTPLEAKLTMVKSLYQAASLPLFFRITPFTLPATLDDDLAAHGFVRPSDDTLVMVCRALPSTTTPAHALPAGFVIERVGTHTLAQAVGRLKGHPLALSQAHAQRLELSPVTWSSYVVKRTSDGAVVTCGQAAIEGDLIGLYDIMTDVNARRQGLATALCEHMMIELQKQPSSTHPGMLLRSAYLQVEANNESAHRIYARMGFADAFQYHYRTLMAPSARSAIRAPTDPSKH